MERGPTLRFVVCPPWSEAVIKFEPFKSPGRDGIYPALLQKGIDTLLPYLVHIFKLSLRNGKLASHWLTIKS